MTEREIIVSELLENMNGTYQGDDATDIYSYIITNVHDTVKVSERVCNKTTPFDFLQYYLADLCAALGYENRLVCKSYCDDDTKKIIQEVFTCCRTIDNRMYVFAKFNKKNGKNTAERISGANARIRNKMIGEFLKGLD